MDHPTPELGLRGRVGFVNFPFLRFVREIHHLFLRSETKKLLAFGAAVFLLRVGYQAAVLSANSLLLHRVGASELFTVYLASSLLALALLSAFFFLSDRFHRNTFFSLTHLALAAAIAGLWLLVGQRPGEPLVYMGARAVFYASYMLAWVQFWVLASEYFNNFQAKRSFPLLIAVGLAGNILGGLFLHWGSARLGTENLFLAYGAALLLIPAVFWAVRPPKDPSLRPVSTGTEPRHAPPASLGKGWGLALLLFGFWMIYTFLCYGTDFSFNAAAAREIRDEDRLTAYYGKVVALASLALLAYQLILARPFGHKLGVDRLLFGILAMMAGAWGWAYLAPSLLSLSLAWALVFIFADFAAVAVLSPVLNVFSAERRGRVKALTEGLGRPAGIFTLFLLAAVSSFEVGLERMGAILAALSLAFLLFPWVFQKVYMRHLLKCLGSSDLNLVANAVQALGERSKGAAAPPLLALLEKTSSVDLKRSIVLTLGQMQSRMALKEIVSLFSVRNESLQVAVLEALGHFRNYEATFALFRLLKSKQNVSFQVRLNATAVLTRLIGKKMIPYLMEALADQDLRIVANAIESIGQLRDPQSVPLLAPYLDHPNHRIRANAAVALYKFRRMRPRVLEVIRRLYQSSDRYAFLAGIYAIGTLKLESYADELLRLLTAPQPETRLHAAVALAKMKRPDFLPTFLQLLSDDEEKAALEAARRLGEFPKYSRWLVFERLAQLPEAPRRRAFRRLDETSMDFSEEKLMIQGKAVWSAGVPY